MSFDTQRFCCALCIEGRAKYALAALLLRWTFSWEWYLLQMLRGLLLCCLEPLEGVHIEQATRYAVQALQQQCHLNVTVRHAIMACSLRSCCHIGNIHVPKCVLHDRCY